MKNNFNSISDIHKQVSNDNIHTIAIGKKHIKNYPTDDLSIIYFVNQKLPLDEIPKDQIIPNEILLDGKVYKTDVIQTKKVKALGCFDYINSPLPPEVLSNRQRHRPILGGTIIGNVLSWNQTSRNTYFVKYGTLGLIAYDNTDNTLVGVTNAHVICDNFLYASESPISELPYNIIDSKYYSNPPEFTLTGNISANISQFYYQPFYFDLYGDCIGRPKRYQPMHLNSENLIDVALIQLKPENVDITSTSQNGIPNTQGLFFASSDEILNSYGSQVLSSGARTGPKGETCPLYIVGVNASTTVTYNIGSNTYTIPVNDSIIFAYPGLPPDYPVDHGDSGSALLLKTIAGYKIMGLVYGGNDTYGFACRIDHIADALNISPYVDQTPIPIVNDPKYIVKPLSQTDTTINYNGKTYWQVGTRLTTEQPI
jgi:hypothetical protein